MKTRTRSDEKELAALTKSTNERHVQGIHMSIMDKVEETEE